MQSLVGAELAPEERARHIRRLRDEWRTLRRGAGEDASPEWQQFEEAAEHAYEPCREYFAQQARSARTTRPGARHCSNDWRPSPREQAGEQPDWRAIQHVLAEAQREWREYAPVDQAVVKSLQERFHAQLAGLRERLDAEYAATSRRSAT